MKVVCPYCGREFEVKCFKGRRGRPPIEIDETRIKRLLSQYNNNKSVVAKILGISRSTLYKLMKKYGLS